MKLDILSALNAERAARRAAIVVTDVEAGVQRLVRAAEVPGDPLEPAPIVRGAAPTPLQAGQRFGQANPQVPPPPPLPLNLGGSHPNHAWQPVTVSPIPRAAPIGRSEGPPIGAPAGVQLLAPQFDPPGFPR